MSQPYVVSEIEIPFSPQDVREVFLDFEHFSDIKSTMITNVSRRKGATGPITVGEVLDGNFGMMGFGGCTVLENTPSTFTWSGIIFTIMAGKHSFYFLPSEKTPGHTTFRHEETPYRISTILFRLLPVQTAFDGFCKDFKTRVEVVKGKPGQATGGGL